LARKSSPYPRSTSTAACACWRTCSANDQRRSCGYRNGRYLRASAQHASWQAALAVAADVGTYNSQDAHRRALEVIAKIPAADAARFEPLLLYAL
jgi:hypothetical protein